MSREQYKKVSALSINVGDEIRMRMANGHTFDTVITKVVERSDLRYSPITIHFKHEIMGDNNEVTEYDKYFYRDNPGALGPLFFKKITPRPEPKPTPKEYYTGESLEQIFDETDSILVQHLVKQLQWANQEIEKLQREKSKIESDAGWEAELLRSEIPRTSGWQ